MQPHQQRVVDEKAELDDKIVKLDYFTQTSPHWAGLPQEEKDRLTEQLAVMQKYSDILAARIAAF